MELVVAIGISALLISMIGVLIARTLGYWERQSDGLKLTQEAGRFFDVFTQDLQSLATFPQRQVYFEVKSATQDKFLDHEATLNAPAIYLLTWVNEFLEENQQLNGICSVVYVPHFSKKIIGRSTYNSILFRSVIDSQNTFEGPLALKLDPDDETTYPSYGWEGHLSWNWSRKEGENNPVSPQWIVNYKNILLSNLGDIAFRLFYKNLETGEIESISHESSFILADKLYVSGTEKFIELQYIDVSITLITEKGMKFLQRPSLGGRSIESIKKEHGKVFTRRIPFLADSL